MGTMQRIAVVTGGARGIGAGIARRLASDGCRVAVLDLDEPGAAALAAEVGGAAFRCDVGDPGSVAPRRRRGGPRRCARE